MATDEMWRPPVNRLMRTLDRSFFQRTIELKAARVFENRNITKCQAALERSKDAIHLQRMQNIRPDPDEELARQGRRCIVLRPETKPAVPENADQVPADGENGAQTTATEHDVVAWPHSSTLDQLVAEKLISVVPYKLHLDYNYWTYHDIMTAILPEDEQGEIPSGYSLVGHIAHLNLRSDYLKYKDTIAQIILDKNPGVKTVINKIDDVGEESEYRTFKYECLAGPDDLNVTVSEEDCYYRFDYSKVYWNSRLNTEHHRLVEHFSEGEAVCDVMAGIGPFAIPAGKKRVFVWANDLNPDSFASLEDAVKRNKVADYVLPFNTDGRQFIRDAVRDLAMAKEPRKAKIFEKVSRKAVTADGANGAAPPPLRKRSPVRTLTSPRTFQHFAMNLPATAITFLPSFIGVYTPEIVSHLGGSPDSIDMPIVHVYCFSTKSHDNVAEGFKICEEISRQLEFTVQPGEIADGGVKVADVRDVAPNKRMFCASFRLPREVAFRSVS